MRRRGMLGLFGLALAACAVVPASPRARPPAALCARRTGRAHRPGDASPAPGRVRAMLADFTGTLRRTYHVRTERELVAERRTATLVVPLRIHVITAGGVGRPSQETLTRQVAALNDAYGGRLGGVGTGVSFRLEGVDVTDDTPWFEHPHDYQAQIHHALARGGPGTLNLFTAAVGSDVLGFSTFPQWYRERPGLDGVYVDYRTLPGGAFPHFDRGFTAVHETGHWLGLFHTFENGCTPPGDGVDDTPYEALPSMTCSGLRDTCSAPGADPVHNFMDYGYDACMREFTPGQGLRIRAMWAAYRAGNARQALG